MKAGKHAVCEKPLVGSLAKVDALIQAEKAYGRTILPIFPYRYGNGVQRAKRLIDLGIAGKPCLGTVETSWWRTAEYYAVPWRGKWATELGGVAQAVIATFQDDSGKPLKQFTIPGPFSESGSARKAVIAKANAWFDHDRE